MSSNSWKEIERIVARYRRAETVRHNLESHAIRRDIAQELRRSPIRYEPPKVKATKTLQDKFEDLGGQDVIDTLKDILK